MELVGCERFTPTSCVLNWCKVEIFSQLVDKGRSYILRQSLCINMHSISFFNRELSRLFGLCIIISTLTFLNIQIYTFIIGFESSNPRSSTIAALQALGTPWIIKTKISS
jgi:hypothetical protein